MTALVRHTTLQEVALSGDLSTTGGLPLVARILEQNTVLKSFKLQIDQLIIPTEIAMLEEDNNVDNNVDNHGDNHGDHSETEQEERENGQTQPEKKVKEHYLLPIARALVENQVLQCLEITGNLFSPRSNMQEVFSPTLSMAQNQTDLSRPSNLRPAPWLRLFHQ